MDEKILEAVSLRNPGALDVCFKLIDYLQELVIFDFDVMLKNGITGHNVWDLYKACDGDIASLHASLMQNTAIGKLGQVPGSDFYKGVKQ